MPESSKASEIQTGIQGLRREILKERDMIAFLKKHRLLVLLVLVIVAIPLTVYAADALREGADNVSNSMTGNIVYSRPSCFDGSTWDRMTCKTSAAPDNIQVIQPVFDADDTAACVAIGAAEADYTLTHDATRICASGNTAYILCASAAPVAADHTVGNFSSVVSAGNCIGPDEFTGNLVCSYIGVAAGGFLCFMGYDYK